MRALLLCGVVMSASEAQAADCEGLRKRVLERDGAALAAIPDQCIDTGMGDQILERADTHWARREWIEAAIDYEVAREITDGGRRCRAAFDAALAWSCAVQPNERCSLAHDELPERAAPPSDSTRMLAWEARTSMNLFEQRCPNSSVMLDLLWRLARLYAWLGEVPLRNWALCRIGRTFPGSIPAARAERVLAAESFDCSKPLCIGRSSQVDGVGLLLDGENGRVRIVAPMQGTPADRAGMKAGDVLVGIDGASTATISISAVTAKIKGPRGTQVMLLVERVGAPTRLRFDLVRERFQTFENRCAPP